MKAVWRSHSWGDQRIVDLEQVSVFGGRRRRSGASRPSLLSHCQGFNCKPSTDGQHRVEGYFDGHSVLGWILPAMGTWRRKGKILESWLLAITLATPSFTRPKKKLAQHIFSPAVIQKFQVQALGSPPSMQNPPHYTLRPWTLAQKPPTGVTSMAVRDPRLLSEAEADLLRGRFLWRGSLTTLPSSSLRRGSPWTFCPQSGTDTPQARTQERGAGRGQTSSTIWWWKVHRARMPSSATSVPG